MGEIFNQLGHLFLQTIPTVILVFLLFIVLEQIFFRPLMQVLKDREALTAGALARAREQAVAAEAKSQEYQDAWQAARQEVYRQREAERHTNLEQRDVTLRKARAQAEALIRDAQAALAAEVAHVRQDLDAASLSLAESISQSVLGSDSTPGQGGLRA